MLNRSASLAMSTSVLKALPGNFDIKDTHLVFSKFGSCSNEGKGECDVFPHPNMEIMERRVRRGRTCRHRRGRPVTDCFITLGIL